MVVRNAFTWVSLKKRENYVVSFVAGNFFVATLSFETFLLQLEQDPKADAIDDTANNPLTLILGTFSEMAEVIVSELPLSRNSHKISPTETP